MNERGGRHQDPFQHSRGGWKLRLQSMAFGLGGCARFFRSSSRPRVPLSREYAVLYFLSNAAVRERGGGVTIEQLTSKMSKVKICESVTELQTTPM